MWSKYVIESNLMLVSLIAFTVLAPVRLWEGDAPLSKGKGEHDVPTMTAYLPKEPAKTAIVVCPGGGYWMLADHEGKDYAEFLAQNGIAAYVLRYRLGQFEYRHPAMLADAQRAIRTVRSYNLYSKIGIMGSSAGGHLAATSSVYFDMNVPSVGDAVDKFSARPDFTVLCYPVISVTAPIGHVGSGDNLLGKGASQEMKDLLNPALHVTKDTPPAFLWHTGEDKGVLMENSLSYASALRAVGVDFDLHVFQKGGHGIGLTTKAPYSNPHPWATDLLFWIKQNVW
jgi:acetyl esterase/lipase